jgi:hypothetical protein
VDEDAPALIRDAAQTIAGSREHPLLNVMTGGAGAAVISSRQLLSAPFAQRAYSHLILVGLPTDPLIRVAWQREAQITPSGFYVFGFGNLKGNIGYIESDRNLFLHSPGVSTTPFETEVVTITGTTPAGIQLACGAFLSQHLINGVVAAQGWLRPQAGLLDRDPLAPSFASPLKAPPKLNEYARVGFTQASEDEYRGVLADTGRTPRLIWRAKYHTAGVWDRPGALAAFDTYSFGLHRRAYGNTRWVAEFDSTADAAYAAPKIAHAAQLVRDGERWTGHQPYYADPNVPGSENRGPLALWREEAFVLMSTLPGE